MVVHWGGGVNYPIVLIKFSCVLRVWQYDAIKKKIDERLQAIGNESNETDELAKRIEISKGRIDGLCIR
jgi:hypothetical protein